MVKATFYVSHCIVTMRLTGEKDGVVQEFGAFSLDLVNENSEDMQSVKNLLAELGGIAHDRMADQIAAWEVEIEKNGAPKPDTINLPKAKVSRDATAIVKQREDEAAAAARKLEQEQAAEAARVAREAAAEVDTTEAKKK